MKLLSVLALGVAGYTSLNDINIDPKDPMGGLSMMMATAQQSLGRAQRHHQKVVDKMRKRVESNFNSEADSVGGVIAEYYENLTVADMRLQTAINTSTAALKKEEAVPSKLDDWMDPGVAERARLHAEINSAERNLQHSLLAHERVVTEAVDTAGQAFEDQSMRLGMKLGDLTEQSENAKKEMQTLVGKKGKAAVQDKLSLAKGKDQQARLKQYETMLTAVQKESQAAAAAVQKRFTQFLSKATNIVGQESDKVLSDLAAAQQQEIEKVLGKKKTTQKVAQKTHDAKVVQRAAIHKYAVTHHGHMPQLPPTTTTTTTTTSASHHATHKKVSKPKQVVKTTTTHTTTTLTPAQKASAHKNHKKHTA